MTVVTQYGPHRRLGIVPAISPISNPTVGIDPHTKPSILPMRLTIQDSGTIWQDNFETEGRHLGYGELIQLRRVVEVGGGGVTQRQFPN